MGLERDDNMVFSTSMVNERLIIDENKIDSACVLIEQIVANKLRQLGYKDVAVEVYFDVECFNENTLQLWKEINIILSIDNNIIGCITYATDSDEPSLVYVDNKFKFYYAFEQLTHTCTNPIDFTDASDEDDIYLEKILIEELEDRLKQDILYLVDGLIC